MILERVRTNVLDAGGAAQVPEEGQLFIRSSETFDTMSRAS